MSVQDWSQELIEHVVDHLHDDRVSLKNCSLVASKWVPRSRHYLFQNLCIDAPSSKSAVEYDTVISILDSPECTIHSSIQNLTLHGISALKWVKKVRDPKPATIEWLEPVFRHLDKWTSVSTLTLERVDRYTRGSNAWKVFIQQPTAFGFNAQITNLTLSHFGITNSVEHSTEFLSIIPAFPSTQRLVFDPFTDASEHVYSCTRTTTGPPIQFLIPGTGGSDFEHQSMLSEFLATLKAKFQSRQTANATVANEQEIVSSDEDLIIVDSEDEGDGTEEETSASAEEDDLEPPNKKKESECNCERGLPPGPDDTQVRHIAENLGPAPRNLRELIVSGKWLYISFPLRILWEWMYLQKVDSVRILDIRLEFMETHDLPAFERYLGMLGSGLKELKCYTGFAGRSFVSNPAPDDLTEGRCDCRKLLRTLTEQKILTKATGIEEATFECMFFYDIARKCPTFIVPPNKLFSTLPGTRLKHLNIAIWTDLELLWRSEPGDARVGKASWYAADTLLANAEMFPVLEAVVVTVTVVKDRNYDRSWSGDEPELSELEVVQKMDKFFPRCKAKGILEFRHLKWRDVKKERFGIVF
ncbi:hypothetical protein VNI00_008782 [Paramarasmius palmivorus]|uniref:F-box protein n=1 Tax=Paramarasmius palmivorus TaxID=297713 RepID=A0AAW0CVF4_9AGAR